MNKQRIILRADGNSEIGLGHIYRCIALCQILKDNFYFLFVIQNPSKVILRIIKQDCPQILLLPVTKNSLQEAEYLASEILRPNDIIVIDSYNICNNYHKIIKNKVYKLIVIDDIANRDIFADIIVNHGSTAIEKKYIANKNNTFNQLLCGLDYLLLRKEFLDIAKRKRIEIEKIDSIFVCIGGSDVDNVTSKVLSAVVEIEFFSRIVLVIGGAYKWKNSLSDYTATISGKVIEVYENIDAKKIIDLLKTCSIAISPASTTALEICCVGTPLISGYTIENQFTILNELLEKECCISMGSFNKAAKDDIIFFLDKLRLNVLNGIVNQQKFWFTGYPLKII